MTHMKTMSEHEGEFSPGTFTVRRCSECRENTRHEVKVWESSCGGYEDEKFICQICKHVFWIDGIDS